MSRLADRLTRSRLVLSVLALAALLAGSGSPAWARAHVTTVLGPEPVSVSGTTAAPALAATALVAGAAGLAVALGRRVGALLGGLALLGSAVAVVAVVSGFLSDPATPVRRAAGEISGVPELTGAVDVTSWPYLTFVLAAALALAGVGIIALSGRWSATGRRFERARPVPEELARGGAAQPSSLARETDERHRSMDDWDALGRGEDPTAEGDGDGGRAR